ncbi:MAG: TSUP family transporter [Burkholderiales bacterium]|nr:TSUP family transporter [Burkholderiales bacterium]
MTVVDLVTLCVCAFAAGWVDAIAGGGGLIQVPALFAVLPGAPPASLLGTNKLSSICGTAAALWRYRRGGLVELRPWKTAVIAALIGSAVGAWVATLMSPTIMRPLVIGLVFVMLVQTLITRRSLGVEAGRFVAPESLQKKLGGGIGFYDGFFGPGTGSLLMFGLVRFGRLDFVRASAAAKVINCATNGGALALFAVSGHVLYALAIPMAAFNLAGGWLGATMAKSRGPRFVRAVFLTMVLALCGKVLWDLTGQH